MTIQGALQAVLRAGGVFPKHDPLGRIEISEIGTEIAAELGLADGWGDPEPIQPALPEVAQFDLDMLPASLRPLVEDVTDRMQIPVDFAAVTVVATLAGVTNRRAQIQPKVNDDSWIVVPNLWGAIVAPPGMLKSPVISTITQSVRIIESEWRDAHKEAQAKYKEALEIHEQELKAWQGTYQKAAKENNSRPAKPQNAVEEPVLRRLITSNATFESLHEIMRQNPAGLFVLVDELTGWLAGLERPGREQERAFYLQCWNGDSEYTVDRIGRGSIHVPHTCVSLFGGIQPARLRSYVSDALQDGASNDGLMQRFQLLVWPDIPADWRYVDRKPDTAARETFFELCKSIVSIDAENPLRLKFDRDGQILFQTWITQHERQLGDETILAALHDHLSKYRSLMPALALLFALADGRRDHVACKYVRLACDWCDYLTTHARRIYASQIRRELQAAITLSCRLRKGWKKVDGTFTVREVYRNQWTGLQTPNEVRAALTILEENGWVRSLPGNVALPGRPSETYSINPRIGVNHAG